MLKDNVLDILEKHKGNIVKGGDLARVFGVSRTAVWKAVHSLREDGNEIISVPNIGYELLPSNDTLSGKSIYDKLSTRFIGRNIKLLPSVDSTNKYLKESDTASLPDGYVVIADEQTSGRGRFSRPFISAKGEGLYLSILLKPDSRQHDIRLLTICAAVAVSKAVDSISGADTTIKWVNDIFLGGRKLCGILTEAVLSGELQAFDTVIVGIGINTGDIGDEIREIATSIRQETGISGIRSSLASEVLNQFEKVYLDYTENCGKTEILRYYESKLFIIGSEITVINYQTEYCATVLGIDDAGGLIVKNTAGDIEHISSGEIRLR